MNPPAISLYLTIQRQGGIIISDLIERAKRSDISSIQKTVSGIMRVINDPEATAKELEQVIETDPPLAARVMQHANSAYYAPQQKINNIKQAIIWIGADALKELALSQKVCGIFKKNRPFSGYSRDNLWKHSTAVAHTAKLIYRREFKQRGENIYAAGLLHDIGFILEDQLEPDLFTQLLKDVQKSDKSMAEVEIDYFESSHGPLGAALLNEWKLPEETTEAIAFHHHPQEAPLPYRQAAMTLMLSDYIVQKHQIGQLGVTEENDELAEQGMKEMKLEKAALEVIIEEVKEQIREMEEEGLL